MKDLNIVHGSYRWGILMSLQLLLRVELPLPHCSSYELALVKVSNKCRRRSSELNYSIF